MKIITVKVDKRTKAGKAFMVMFETFLKEEEGVEVLKISSK